VRITRRQLRRIIREAIEGPDGVWYDDYGNRLQQDDPHRLEGESVDDPDDKKVGDLVRKIDYYGTGYGEDYKKTVGDQIGTVIEIDEDPDGTQYTVFFPDGTTIMDTADTFELVNETREYRHILSEVPFHDSPDEDLPGKKKTIVFSEDEVYEVEGSTHGKESHAIKHFSEFEPGKVQAAVEQAMAIAKDADEVYIIDRGGNVVHSGDDAKKQINLNSMLNTLDLVNDKQKNNKPLVGVEEELAPIILSLTKEYDQLVADYVGSDNDIDDIDDPEEIKKVLAAGEVVKFTGKYGGATYTYYMNPTNSGLAAMDKNGTVATLFRIDKRGADLKKIAGYFGRGVELSNPAFSKAIGVGAEEPKADKEKKKGNVSYSGVVLKNPDDILKNPEIQKILDDNPDFTKLIGHHMTINLGALDDSRGWELGADASLNVVSWGIIDSDSARAIAVKVEPPSGMTTKNANPHITVAVPEGGKPVDSNKIQDWGNPLKGFSIDGTVTEVEQKQQQAKKKKAQKKPKQTAASPEDFVKQLKTRGLPDQALKGALTGWLKKNAPDRMGDVDDLLAAGRVEAGEILVERWQQLAGLLK
jgi:hypothetical protein